MGNKPLLKSEMNILMCLISQGLLENFFVNCAPTYIYYSQTMGSNCCSVTSSALSPSIRQTDFGPVRPNQNTQHAGQQSNPNNTLLSTTLMIFKQLEKRDPQTCQRISEFIRVNQLPTFSHHGNSQLQTCEHEDKEEEKKKEGEVEQEWSEKPEKYYFGNFENGKAEGIGVLYCQNRYCYLGNFREGNISGQGILYYLHSSGDEEETLQAFEEYEGGFIDGKAQGYGKYTKRQTQNNRIEKGSQVEFLGQWIAGTPCAGSVKFGLQSNIRNLQILDIKTREGILYTRDGSKYKGHLNDKLEPEGIGTYTKGECEYSGGWLMGRFHGYGRFTWENGERYEGNYSNGKKQGAGKFVFKSGNYYEGTWLNGHQNGRGALHSKEGDLIKKGVWADGILQIEIPDEEWEEYKKSIPENIDF